MEKPFLFRKILLLRINKKNNMKMNTIFTVIISGLLLCTLRAQEKLALVKNEYSEWKVEEHEASLKREIDNGAGILNFNILIDHKRDKKGDSKGKILKNWPRLMYVFVPVADMSKFKNLQFEYKLTSNNKYNRRTPVSISFYSLNGKSFDYILNFAKNDNTWHKIVIDVKDLLERSKTEIDDWKELLHVQIGVAEKNFIHGDKINFKFKNIFLSSKAAVGENSVKNAIILNLPLNNISGTTDRSRFKNNGTLAGSAAIVNDALVLGGKKSYINCGGNEILELGKGDITITAKIKLAVNQPERSGIISKGAGSSVDGGYAFMYRVPKKALYFYVSNGSKRAIFSSKVVFLNDNKWHTVAVSLSRGIEVIFSVDGKNQGIRKENQIPADNISNPERSLLIGSWNKSHFMNGAIKDVRIYNKAFSAKELVEMTQ